MKIKELKEDLISDYSNWVYVAFDGMDDSLGIQEQAINNFKLKLSNLITLIENEQKEEEEFKSNCNYTAEDIAYLNESREQLGEND